MIRHLLAFAVVAIALAASCRPSHGDNSRTPVRVTIAVTAGGVSAKFRLAKPAERFALEYNDGVLREKSWTLPQNFVLQDHAITTVDGTPFNAFDVAIRAHNELADAVYACVMRLGEGRVVYASYFAGEQSAFDTTIDFLVSEGETVLGLPMPGATLRVDRTAVAGDQAGDFYVYMGPVKHVKRARLATYVVDPDAPPWAQLEIEKLAEPSLAFYRRKTGVALLRAPVIMTTVTPGSSGSLVADVTDGPNVAFRILGDAWKSQTVKATARLRHMAMHEYAHFWNSHRYHSSDNENARWLHEGGAEYWARLAEAAAQRSKAALLSSNERVLNDCVDRLRDQPLPRTRSGPHYPCGEVLQWFADLGMQESGGDIFDLWREIFRKAESNGGYYSAKMFRELAERGAPAVGEAMSIVLDRHGVERWAELPHALAPLGVTLDALPPSERAYRDAAVMHVLASTCKKSYGFWTEKNWLKLDTGDRCGPLSGDPEVDTVNGRNLFTDPVGAFTAVEAACRANGAVTFGRQNQTDTWTVTCAKPLSRPPPSFRMVAMSQ